MWPRHARRRLQHVARVTQPQLSVGSERITIAFVAAFSTFSQSRVFSTTPAECVWTLETKAINKNKKTQKATKIIRHHEILLVSTKKQFYLEKKNNHRRSHSRQKTSGRKKCNLGINSSIVEVGGKSCALGGAAAGANFGACSLVWAREFRTKAVKCLYM